MLVSAAGLSIEEYRRAPLLVGARVWAAGATWVGARGHSVVTRPRARRIGLQLAYDDVLVDACAALEVANTLTALPLGAERDAERLYVEHKLDAAGLRLHV